MAANLIDSLTCPICLKFCVEPVETNCCHKIYCKACADNLNGICALCRQKFRYSFSLFAKRQIDSLMTECKYCNEKFTRGDIKTHSLKCILIRCPICQRKIAKKNGLSHLIEYHYEQLESKLDDILDLYEYKSEKRFKSTKEFSSFSNKNTVTPKSVNASNKPNENNLILIPVTPSVTNAGFATGAQLENNASAPTTNFLAQPTGPRDNQRPNTTTNSAFINNPYAIKFHTTTYHSKPFFQFGLPAATTSGIGNQSQPNTSNQTQTNMPANAGASSNDSITNNLKKNS